MIKCDCNCTNVDICNYYKITIMTVTPPPFGTQFSWILDCTPYAKDRCEVGKKI